MGQLSRDRPETGPALRRDGKQLQHPGGRAAAGDPDAQRDCIDPANHIDAVLALDLKTGAIKWATAALPFDAWTVACIFGGGPNCPEPAGPDYDFGQAPQLYTAMIGGKRTELLGAG